MMKTDAQNMKAIPFQSGYSLIEVVLVLILLSVTTIPMTILLAKQQADIDKASTTTISQILTNQLFDDVNPRHPAVTTYNVSTLKSITCDPAGKNGPTVGTQLTCTPTQGPFFTRTIAFQPITVPAGFSFQTFQTTTQPTGLTVTVNLYNHQTDNSPYYTASRNYHLDYYNIASSSPTQYVNMSLPTFEDNLHYFPKDVTPFSTVISPLLSYYDQGNSISTKTQTLADGSMADYFPLSSHLDYFQVEPTKTYDITLNFIYFTQNGSSPNGDSSEVANIQIIGYNYNPQNPLYPYSYNTMETLQTFNNFDIASPVGGSTAGQNAGVGVPFHTQITVPQNENVLGIIVAPAASGNYFYLKSIKLVQRNDS